MAVDPGTEAQFNRAVASAKKHGYPLMEVLDRSDLLLTTKRKHDLEVQANEQLWQRLDRQSPNKLMSYFHQKPDGTAHEMFEALKQWLALVINNQAEGTLEDL